MGSCHIPDLDRASQSVAPFSEAQKAQELAGVTTALGWDLNSDLWLLSSAPASWVKPGGCWA